MAMKDAEFVEKCIPDSLRLAKHQDAELVNQAIATALLAYRKALRDNVWEKNIASDIARAMSGYMESVYVPHIAKEEEDWGKLQLEAEEARVMKASAAELAKAGGLDTIRTKVISLGDKQEEPASMPEVQSESDTSLEASEDSEEPVPEPIECEKKVEEENLPTLNVTAPRAARFDSKDKGSQLFNIVSPDGRSAAVGAFKKKGPKYYATVDVIVDGGRHKGTGDSAIAAVVDAVSDSQFRSMALSFDTGFDKYVDDSSSKKPEEWHYKKPGDKTCSICGFVGNVKAEHRKRADGRFEKYVKVCFGTDYDIVPIESKTTVEPMATGDNLVTITSVRKTKDVKNLDQGWQFDYSGAASGTGSLTYVRSALGENLFACEILDSSGNLIASKSSELAGSAIRRAFNKAGYKLSAMPRFAEEVDAK